MNIILSIIVMLFVSIHTFGQGLITVKVIEVHDGDTFTVLDNFKKKKCRFSNIDAPELTQPYGRTSRDSLKGRILNKFVKVLFKGKDVYNRNITELYTLNGGRYDSLTVAKGWAWNYKEYNDTVPWLQTLQNNAKTLRIGLWSCEEKYIIEPKIWRKVYKRLKANLIACP